MISPNNREISVVTTHGKRPELSGLDGVYENILKGNAEFSDEDMYQ